MPHTHTTLLKARLAIVRRDLDQIVGRITPEMLGWAPGDGMRTLSGQIVEIVGTEMQLIAEINDDRIISDPEAREIIGDCNDLDVLRAALLEVRSKALAYLDSLSDAELAEEVPSRGGWLGALRLGAIPRGGVHYHCTARVVPRRPAHELSLGARRPSIQLVIKSEAQSNRPAWATMFRIAGLIGLWL